MLKTWLLFTSFALAGCNIGSKSDPRICNTPAHQSLEQIAQSGNDLSYGAQANRASDCVARNAYRLAGAPGSIAEIANAAVGGCAESFPGVVSAQLASAAKAGIPFIGTNPITGDTVSPEAQLYEEMRLQALYNVAAARAGHCDVERSIGG